MLRNFVSRPKKRTQTENVSEKDAHYKIRKLWHGGENYTTRSRMTLTAHEPLLWMKIRNTRRFLYGGVMSSENIILLTKNFNKSDHIGKINFCG